LTQRLLESHQCLEKRCGQLERLAGDLNCEQCRRLNCQQCWRLRAANISKYWPKEKFNWEEQALVRVKLVLRGCAGAEAIRVRFFDDKTAQIIVSADEWPIQLPILRLRRALRLPVMINTVLP